MFVLIDKRQNRKPIRLFNDWIEIMQWTNHHVNDENSDQYSVSELYWFEVLYYKWFCGLVPPKRR